MVMTMAGVQEARRISTGDPTKLIAALTAAFALGQLTGPIVVNMSPSAATGLMLASSLAAALLVLSALALLCIPAGALARAEPLSNQRNP